MDEICFRILIRNERPKTITRSITESCLCMIGIWAKDCIKSSAFPSHFPFELVKQTGIFDRLDHSIANKMEI